MTAALIFAGVAFGLGVSLRILVIVSDIASRCQRLLIDLDVLRDEHRRQLEKENTIMATLDDLVTDVAAETTLAGSIKTLVQGVAAKLTDLSAQLAAAIAANDPAKIQQVHDALTAANASLQASADALTAAVPANVPGA